MTTNEKAELYDRVISSRTAIVKQYPFYGTLLLSLNIVFADCGTAATDGRKLYFDPDFIKNFTDKQLQFLFLHELMHCILKHTTRGKGKAPFYFNVACDIVANSNIMRSMPELYGIEIAGEIPMHTVEDTGTEMEGYLYSAEEVYSLILKSNRNQGKGSKLSLKKKMFDRHDTWEDIDAPKEEERRWKEKIKEVFKKLGGLKNHEIALAPDEIRNIHKEILASQCDWSAILQEYFQSAEQKDISFRHPARKGIYRGMYLPSYYDTGEKCMRDIWILVDASASMDSKEISIALSEIIGAMQQFDMKGKFSYFGNKVTTPTDFETKEDILDAKPQGTGFGTNFPEIFHYMNSHKETLSPKVILIFTDGFGRFPDEQEALQGEDIAVIWAIESDMEAPWGRVVHFPCNE